jgi:4-hydroxy-2-oxoheptanedioate aldolase
MSAYTPTLPPNRFKAALSEKRPQIGLWSSLCSNLVAELLANLGYDWIVVDSEHAPNDPVDVLAQLQAMTGGSAEPMVRVPWNDAVLIKRILDVGGRTLLIPFVQSAEEARQAVAATRYPPRGIRGVSVAPRANRFGRVPGYLQNAERDICIVVQLETRAAIADACRRIRAAGKPAGILAPVEADARRFFEMGFSYVAIGSDVGLLASAGAAALARMREAVAP